MEKKTIEEVAVFNRGYIAGAKNQSEQNQWIRVEDRLPEERKEWSHSLDVNILLRGESELFVSTGAYSYDSKKWHDYLYNGNYEIIAWMPLPSLPKQ
jgi:hypothetical protein